MIGFHSGVSAAQRHAIEHAAGTLGSRRLGPVLKPVGHGRVTGAEYLSPYELRVPDGRVFSAVAQLQRNPGVAYAEPNYLERATAIEAPNDPKFPEQWGDENSGQAIPFQDTSEKEGAKENGTPGADDHALAAWNSLEASGKTVGSRSIVIGEVDTGVDYTDLDLKANIWSNPGGIGQNEKKEHICAAGTHGYNVLNETCNPIDEDTDYGGHGTHVAGIMGAEGNNGEGVAGMNWQTTILPVRWLNKANTLSPTSELVKALLWLVGVKQEGENVRVVNDSDVIEGKTGSAALEHAIETLGANNILFVTAAGNTGKNNDEVERYPCKYDKPTEICVAASNNKDELPTWASYGPKTVDLAAPGTSIYSTLREGKYGYLSGGSMASPQVAGAAALILSKASFTATELKADILNNVDKLPSLEGKVITGGRLDVCKALPGCTTGRQPTVTTNAASSVTQTAATLNGTVDPNDRTVTDCHFDYGTSQSYGSVAPCSSLPGAGESPVAVSVSLGSLSENTTYHFRIVATSSAGTSYGNDQAFVTFPNPPTVTTGTAALIDQTSATLNATVNPNGGTVTDCHFDYGTSESYGSSAPCASLPGSGSSSVAVAVSVGSLSANASYHFRIVATNSGGTSFGHDQAFTTLPDLPTVTTSATSAITQGSATLNATVNPNGAAVSDCHFEYGTSLSYGSSVPCTSLPESGSSAVTESVPITGLSSLTTYYARVVATNSGGTSYGAAEAFTTLPAKEEPNPPLAVTGAASALTSSSATLNATVNPESASVSDCHFDYGTSTSFGSSLPCTSPPESSNSAVPVSASASADGLAAGASYYYRIVATNAGGTSYGAAEAFTTQLATTPFVPQGPHSPSPLPGQGVLATQENKTPPVWSAELASAALLVTTSGTVSVKVICPAGQSSCAGTVTLWTFNAVRVSPTGHQPKRRKTVVLTIARGSFTAVGGRVTTVTLHLSLQARALLARTNVLHVRATIVARDLNGATHTKQVAVTLRLAATRRAR
jgi:subtilisin family serine protease